MKKVTVYLDKNKYEVEVDDSIFEDYKLEACTQVIERLFKNNNYNITPFMFCEDLTDKKNKNKSRFGTYNTYKLILNAGYHSLAEKLRKIFYEENHLDLANEPIKSKLNS